MESASTPIWLSVLSLVGIVLGFAYTWFRDGRARKWEREDRAALALQTSLTADSVKAASHQESSQLAAKLDQETLAIKESIHLASLAAKEAYAEANALNVKIADLQKQLKTLIDRRAKPRDGNDRRTL